MMGRRPVLPATEEGIFCGGSKRFRQLGLT